jgi:hypothetical protein
MPGWRVRRRAGRKATGMSTWVRKFRLCHGLLVLTRLWLHICEPAHSFCHSQASDFLIAAFGLRVLRNGLGTVKK